MDGAFASPERQSIKAAARFERAVGAMPTDLPTAKVEEILALGVRGAEATILEAMNRDAAHVRKAAVRAASRARLEAAVPRLLEIADKTLDGGLRLATIEALGRVGDKSSVELLLTVFRGANGNRNGIRVAAAQALAAR